MPIPNINPLSILRTYELLGNLTLFISGLSEKTNFKYAGYFVDLYYFM